MLEFLPTPAVILFETKIDLNIKNMQRKANKFSLSLRPHIKTHKSLFLAQKQIDEGAVGITCSKVSEALPFIKGGIPSVTLAYPLVDSDKIELLFNAALENKSNLFCVVDDFIHIEKLRGKNANIFIKINVGLNRIGVSPLSNKTIKLAEMIQTIPELKLVGVLSHAGHAYSSPNREEVIKIAEAERQLMVSEKKRLEEKGFNNLKISIGSTPTVLASQNFEGIDEIRPGNYIFMDQTPKRLSLIGDDEIALQVLAQVVSENDSYYIIDAGSKVLSSDQGAHGTSSIKNYGQVFSLEKNKDSFLVIDRLSEEHGFIKKEDHLKLKISDKVLITPNHSCTVANLANEYLLVKSDGQIAEIKIDSRGMTK